MLNIEKLLKTYNFNSFENKSFLASTWRITKRPNTFLSNIKGLKNILMLFYKKISNLYHQKIIIKDNTLIFYARFESSSSLGTILPIIKAYKNPKVLITNQHTKPHAGDFQIIELSSLFYNVNVERYFTLLYYSLKLGLGYRRITKEYIDFQLVSEYFMGYLSYESLKVSMNHSAKIVVDGDFEPVSRGLVCSVNKRGGTSFCLQHGTFGKHLFPTYVKKYIVWGEHFVTELKKISESEIDILPLGYPRIDAMYSNDRMSEYDFDYQKDYVLIISNLHAPHYKEYLSNYFKIIEKIILAGKKVIVKLHVSENIDLYSSRLNDDIFHKLIILKNEIPLISLLKNCKCVFLIESAVAVEAIILKKPLIILKNHFNNFPDYDCGIWVNPDNVNSVIDDIFDQEKCNKIIKKQNLYFDKLVSNFGHSIDFILKEIQGE